MAEVTVTKSKVFKEDLSLATGGTGADETGVRLTSIGGEVTLTKLDASHIKFQTISKSIDDLIDGGQDITLKPSSITMNGTLTNEAETVAGFVKVTDAGIFSGGHSIATSDLPNAISATNIADGTVSNAAFQRIATVSSNVQDQLDALAAVPAVNFPFAILQNRQTKNTSGGEATTGSWGIIPFNVEYEDEDGIVDVTALPAFSLASGTYRIEVNAPFNQTTYTQLRLYNVTDGIVQVNVNSLDIYSASSYLTYSYEQGGVVSMHGTITLAAAKQLRVEYYVGHTVANGLGAACNYGPEVYAQILITKLA